MIGKVFHPSEPLPVTIMENYYDGGLNFFFHVLNVTYEDLRLFLLEEFLLPPHHRFLYNAF